MLKNTNFIFIIHAFKLKIYVIFFSSSILYTLEETIVKNIICTQFNENLVENIGIQMTFDV